MAKNRNKKKTNGGGAGPMDVSTTESAANGAQAMDTSEGNPSSIPALGLTSRKIKKGMPMRRSKSIRRQKAVARAICNQEKMVEQVSKNKNKVSRIQSAKSLYD